MKQRFHFKIVEVQAATKKGNTFSFLSPFPHLPCACVTTIKQSQDRTLHEYVKLLRAFLILLMSPPCFPTSCSAFRHRYSQYSDRGGFLGLLPGSQETVVLVAEAIDA